MTQTAGSQPQTQMVEYIRVQNPEDGVVLRSIGWTQGTGGSRTTLQCKGCIATFHWAPDAENRWFPNRRHLNHCPGCGKTITAFEIPANRK